MQTSDLAKSYQGKSDEELIHLAAVQEQLTPEARLVLESELARRQLNVQEHSGCSPESKELRDGSRLLASKKSSENERQHVGDFLTEVFRTYHNHFWLFFKITAPAVVIGMIAIVAGRNEGREIARQLPRGVALLSYRTQIFEIWLLNSSAWLVSWLAFSFAFGATCIAVEEAIAGFSPSAWRSVLNIRERLGPFLRLCLVLFVLVVAVEAASTLLAIAGFWVLHQWQAQPTGSLISFSLVSFGIVGVGLLLVSRFALAVPAVLLDDCTVRQAMFRSDKFTQGKGLTLAALLVKSIVGGYLAGMCPFWLASLVPATIPLPAWFSFVLTCVSIIGVSAVEPTMFVGFALLYLKMSALGSAASEELTSQLA
jgi:hypothetical protein